MHRSTCISAAEPSAPAECRSFAFSEEEEDWIGLVFRSRAANSRWPLQEGVAPHAQVGDPCHSRGVHDQRFKEFWQAGRGLEQGVQRTAACMMSVEARMTGQHAFACTKVRNFQTCSLHSGLPDL